MPATSCRSICWKAILLANIGKVIEGSGGEIVDSANLVSLFHERMGQR